ncbi:glycerate kinase [Anaerofilum sp. BX8]|uniref:Glycerate kinase n=1 Tax=Anaerofilum hominis TaxID=2763016 RepID=A0A923IAJ2_9FIRM|nr:glycerate kinase [Anaerofilum hominis]MBC5581876.1 glycerate kinase [Anaerofilum hominis]
MKKVILIPDSFKGTMSSAEICEIMGACIHARWPEALTVKIPVADGGEGSVDAFLGAMGGEKVPCRVTGPRGTLCDAFYGRIGGIAVIEMAAAAGLPMMGEELDAAGATTFGVGELMLAAARAGAKKIIMGLGGSATNDGGCGAAAACGVRFLDEAGTAFVPTGGSLSRIRRIDASGLSPLLGGVEIVTMCDIDNPLCGPQGAAAVFGPQKGADPAQVTLLDRGLAHLAGLVKRDLGADILQLPGAGAAGGMGGGMVAFFGSALQMGIETVLETVGFEAALEGTDAVFTGEGRIDGQSLRGKVVVGVARAARKKGVPVIAVVGDIADGAEAAYAEGVSAIFSINRVAVPYSEAKKRAKSDLRLTMDNLLRFMELWKA